MDTNHNNQHPTKPFNSVEAHHNRMRQMSIPGIFNFGQFDISKDYGMLNDYIMAMTCGLNERPNITNPPVHATILPCPVKQHPHMDNFVSIKKFADIDPPTTSPLVKGHQNS